MFHILNVNKQSINFMTAGINIHIFKNMFRCVYFVLLSSKITRLLVTVFLKSSLIIGKLFFITVCLCSFFLFVCLYFSLGALQVSVWLSFSSMQPEPQQYIAKKDCNEFQTFFFNHHFYCINTRRYYDKLLRSSFHVATEEKHPQSMMLPPHFTLGVGLVRLFCSVTFSTTFSSLYVGQGLFIFLFVSGEQLYRHICYISCKACSKLQAGPPLTIYATCFIFSTKS